MTTTASQIAHFNQQFAIDDVASFISGEGGLPMLAVKTNAAEARVYPHGAHVTHFQPAAHKPVIWMSSRSAFAHDKPIRGGVPICCPWFGAKAGDDKAPAHGLVRQRDWQIRSIDADDNGVRIVMSLEFVPTARDTWPAPFVITHTIDIGPTLRMQLDVEHGGEETLAYEMALHTYLSVGDVRRISVSGLEEVGYIDKVDDFKHKPAAGRPIAITAETDRIYLDTADACRLHDPSMNRVITIEKSGSNSTIVWNPWIDKSKRMPDFGDDEWPDMICIETANVADNAVTIDPGRSHSMSATIRADSM